MIYKLEVRDNMGDNLIFSETVFSPAQVEEALGRMERRTEWQEERTKELEMNNNPF